MRLFLLMAVLLGGAALLMTNYPFLLALAIMFAGGLLAALLFVLVPRLMRSRDAGNNRMKGAFQLHRKSDDADSDDREAA